MTGTSEQRGVLDIGRLRLRTVLAAVACILMASFALSLACPGTARAWFNEVDTKNTAEQQLKAYGETVYPDSIPDGTYTVRVYTSSSMCSFYATAEAAAAYDHADGVYNICAISVNNGSITAVFYLTRAYTHLFMGTSAQAAESTNAAGDDESAYLKGDPDANAMSYLYTIAVPALNYPITFATFDGGSRGVEGGKWYQREAVLVPIAGSALEQAINGTADGTGGDDASSGEQGGDGSQGGADDATAQEGAQESAQGGESGAAGTTGGDPIPDSNSEGDSLSADDQHSSDDGGSNANGSDGQQGERKPNDRSKGGLSGDSGQPAPVVAGAGGSDDGAGGSGGAGGESAGSASRGSVPAGSVRHGVLMSPAEMKLDVPLGDVQQALSVDEPDRGLTPVQIVAIALAAAVLFGAVLRVVLFRNALKRKGGMRLRSLLRI